MEDFTQKLLQRTQARKEALARKRENLGLSRADILTPRENQKGHADTHGNNTKTNGKENSLNSKMSQLPQKRESSDNKDTLTPEFVDKRRKFESSSQTNAAKSINKGTGSTTTKVLSGQRKETCGGTIQERLAQLQSQAKRFESDVEERKKERQREVLNQRETNSINKTTPATVTVSKVSTETKQKKEHTEKAISMDPVPANDDESGNSGTPISTSDIDRILGLMEADDTPTPKKDHITEKRYSKTYTGKYGLGATKVDDVPAKRDYEKDSRYVKTYASKEDIDSVKILKIGTSQRIKSNGTIKDKELLKVESAPEVNMDVDYSTDGTTDISVSVSEVSDFLDSEQVDSTLCDEDEESCASDDVEYESESEGEAFDVEGVLAAADGAKNKRQLSKQHLLPDERQEFHVLSPATPGSVPRQFDLNTTEGDDSNSGHLSSFEKLLREKGNQIKSPSTVEKLLTLDKDTRSRAIMQAEQMMNREENQKCDVTATKTAQSTTRNEKTAPTEAKEETDGQFLGIDIANMPLTPAFSTVKESSKSRKKARRSVSFSGNRTSPKVIFKSGYNEEASAKYNVKSNIREAPKERVKTAPNHQNIQYYLEEAANHQSIVLQASQALNMSYGSSEDKRGCPEVVEGERLLLLATQKRNACLDEVQRLKDLGDPFGRPKDTVDGVVPPCKGTIIFSDISLPLNQDFMMALRAGRMDLGVFHFVVVVQYGALQVYATRAVSTYDQLHGNCLPFKEKLTVKSVAHDFSVTVKVFGMHTKRLDLMAKGKKAGSGSKGKESPGILNVFRRRGASEDSPGASSPQKTIFRNSNFTLVGETKMNLATIGAGKFVLSKVPSNSPLDGFVHLNARCAPEFSAKATGFLTLFEDVGGYTALNRRWCVLQNNSLSCWRYPGDEETKEPLGKIEFKWCINETVGLIPRDLCARPHTFEVLLRRPATQDDQPSLVATIEGKNVTLKHWLSADNKEDRISWLDTINKLLSDDRAWQVKRSGVKSHYSQRKSSLRASNHRMKKNEVSNTSTKC